MSTMLVALSWRKLKIGWEIIFFYW